MRLSATIAVQTDSQRVRFAQPTTSNQLHASASVRTNYAFHRVASRTFTSVTYLEISVTVGKVGVGCKTEVWRVGVLRGVHGQKHRCSSGAKPH